MAVAEHPSVAELEAFTSGSLDGAAQAEVEAHVATCTACQDRAATVTDDGLVELLRRAHSRVTESATVALAPPHSLTPSGVEVPTLNDATLTPKELLRHERYRVLRLLGEGGMGAVYAAEHCVMQRTVALKVIRRDYTASTAAVERFRREVRAAAKLSHPNIVTAFDAETAGETHFLVMEYVEGVSLARLVKESGPLPVAQACAAVHQAALGLQHAHERGMIHRDVKPDNLIRTADGTVKVLDFGLAALTAERGQDGLSSDNAIVGTPEYMSPEQADDSRQADIRSDVYSLGCTLYYLLVGQVPYPAATTLQKILGHRERAVPTVHAVRPEVPPELSAVVARLLAKQPEERFATPGEVAAALEPFTRKQPTAPRPPARGWKLAAALVLGLAALAAGAVYRVQTDKGELVITTESEDVEVVIKQNGKVVRVVDTKTNKAITLRSGEYELELKDAPGLKLDVAKATLSRGQTVLARIERLEPVQRDVTPRGGWVVAELPTKVGLMRNPLVQTSGFDIPYLSNDARLIALPVSLRQWEVNKLRVEETGSGRLVGEVGSGGENITNAVFTGDGKRVVYTTIAVDGALAIVDWNLEDGKGRKVLLPAEQRGWPHTLTSSADGSRLGMTNELRDGVWVGRVVDTATGKLLSEVRQSKERTGLVFCRVSADGKRALFILNSPVPRKAEDTFEVIVKDLGGKGGESRSVLKGWAGDLFEDAAGGRFGFARYRGETQTDLTFVDAITAKEVAIYYPADAPKGRVAGTSGTHRISIATAKHTFVYDPPNDKPVATVEPQYGFSSDGRVSWVVRDGRYWLYRHPDPKKQ